MCYNLSEVNSNITINAQNGKDAEFLFREWMNHLDIPYLFIEQGYKTASSALSKTFGGKRPDYMLLIPRIGSIVIDVKSRKNYNNMFHLEIDDVKKYLNLEKYFNFKIWITFYDKSLKDYSFYWITLQKVNECKMLDTVSQRQIYRIPMNHCTKIYLGETSEEVLTKIISIAREG